MLIARLIEALKHRPGVEIYTVTTEDDIEMGLLNDLHCPSNWLSSAVMRRGTQRNSTAQHGSKTRLTLKETCCSLGAYRKTSSGPIWIRRIQLKCTVVSDLVAAASVTDSSRVLDNSGT